MAHCLDQLALRWDDFIMQLPMHMQFCSFSYHLLHPLGAVLQGVFVTRKASTRKALHDQTCQHAAWQPHMAQGLGSCGPALKPGQGGADNHVSTVPTH